MNFLQSLILGIVQGLTEFLPVSSSAHLNIFPWLFGWQNIPPSFDFALHAGTLFSILIYFFKDWVSLVCGGVKLVFKKDSGKQGKMFWYIVAATIPAGIFGMLLEKLVDKIFEEHINTLMIVIALALIIMGIILYLADKNSKRTVKYKDVTFKQTFIVGVSQAIAAAIPGVSRSGITTAVARKFGIDRTSAAKLSFMLSAPIIGGGVLVSLNKFEFSLPFIVGILASMVTGFAVIGFLMSFLKKGSYKSFAVYRIIFGLFIIAVALIRIF